MISARLMSPDPIARGSYLNSNDAQLSENGKVMRKLCRIRFLSEDPRSPSAGIVRTPIQVRIYLFRQFSPVCKVTRLTLSKIISTA
jgi:hypothetical protein